jgi:MFS family permease
MADPNRRPTPKTGSSGQLTLLYSLYCLRLLSLSFVLPVLAPFARDLKYSTAAWTGFTVGVYGLATGIFQVPFGMASDRLSRKKIMALGLVIFAAGSFICAWSDTIFWLLLGRALQGAGAVASTLLAYVADLTDEESRPQAMAWLGTFVGVSFGVGLVAGPILVHNFTLPVVFWGSGVLCLVGAVAAMLLLPETPRARRAASHSTQSLSGQREVFQDGTLVRLTIQVFLLHFTMNALFVIVPLRLVHAVNPRDLWFAYVPVIVAGLIAMFAATALQKKFPRPDLFVLFAWISVAAGTYLAMAAPSRRAPVVTALILFVAGFAVLEPLLPAIFTRVARTSVRGAALGLFNGGQFVGAFFGSLMAGVLVEKVSPQTLGWVFGGMAAVSVLLVHGLRDAAFLKVLHVSVDSMSHAQELAMADRLRKIPGVRDVSVDGEDFLHIQCDTRRCSEEMLRREVAGA